MQRNLSRGAKHWRSQEKQCHLQTNERDDVRLLWKDFRKMNCAKISRSSSDGPENITSIGVRSYSLISHKQLRGESVRNMKNNLALDINGRGQKSGPMQKEEDRFPESGKQSFGFAETSGESKSVNLATFTIRSETDRRTSKSWRLFESMLTDCHKMLDFSSVCEQTCFTFITRLITYHVVMWATQLSTVDWVSSKTQILQDTLKIRNQHQGESHVFSWKSNILFP